ncbi:hypothetical protein DVH24_009495 [Malus domestica]|uniref:Uncharacterized protein n=1 Tax=Malus domestica TaxID=3750 RepID=A0A498IU15_MALDO|nr:hypothetical protein DVH24_009495 [Malus domestica]
MGFEALRSIVRPLSRTIISRTSTSSMTSLAASCVCPKPELPFISGRQAPWFFPVSNYFHSLTDTRFPKRRPVDKPRRKRASVRPPGPFAAVQYVPGEPIVPNRPNEGSVKRRNEKKRMRQRRAFILSLRLSYSEMLSFPVKAERKDIIRFTFGISVGNMRNHHHNGVTLAWDNPLEMSRLLICTAFEFVQAEKKKRKALVQEAKRKKVIKRVERKMAAVARERAWTQRLAELQKLEEEKKNSMA